MNKKNTKSRISIGIEKQGDRALIYDLSVLKEFKDNRKSNTPQGVSLEVGNEFIYEGSRYRIKEMKIYLFEKPEDFSRSMDVRGLVEETGPEFNSEIILMVEDVSE